MHIGRCVRYSTRTTEVQRTVLYLLVTLTDAREHMRSYRQIADAILAMAFWHIIGTGQIKRSGLTVEDYK
jgi:hypothetical protein